MSNETSARIEGESGAQPDFNVIHECANECGDTVEWNSICWVHSTTHEVYCDMGGESYVLAAPKSAAPPEPKVGESGLSDEQLLRSIYDFSVHKPDLRKTDPLWHIRDGSGCILGSGYTEKLAIKDAADRIRLSPTPEAKPEPLPNTLQEDAEIYKLGFNDGVNACVVYMNVHPWSLDSKKMLDELVFAAPNTRQEERIEAVSLIQQERHRQIESGWTLEHDDQHQYGALAKQAAALAVKHTDAVVMDDGEAIDPWGLAEKHRNDEVRSLVISGALIVAEIERIQRLKPAAPKVVDSKEEQFGIGPGTIKQCAHLDGERYCCRLRDGHGGDHIPWTADDIAKLHQPKEEQDGEQDFHTRAANQRAADAEYASRKAESVAPPSLPTQGFEDWWKEFKKTPDHVPGIYHRAMAEAAWNASRAAEPVALPTHRVVETTIQDGGIACLQCSCGRYFIGLGGEALASSRASFEAHLPRL